MGVGPGRYTLEHPLVNPNVPPHFWSYNAHGMYVEVLTEFGVLGALALALILIVGGIALWQRRRAPQALPVLAALAGWLGQMLVDDFTSWIAIMAPLLLLTAWVLSTPTAPEPAAKARSGLRIAWLWLPVLALLGYAAWDLWGFQPMWAGLSAADAGRWPEAAAQISASAARDPLLGYYATEAGLSTALAWGQTNDPAALAAARDWLWRSAQHEPQLSPLWANLAALDWQAGAHDLALARVRLAMQQSPLEPSYPLNQGYFYEAYGDPTDALAAYRLALDLAPEWRVHPFWQTSPLRAQALAEWSANAPAAAPPSAELSAFEAQLQAGDLPAARRSLTLASIGSDISAPQGRLSEAAGDLPAALTAYTSVRDLIEPPILRRSSNFSFAYTRWAYNRPGLLVDRVPGYLNLDGDPARFAALERLHALQVQGQSCTEAAHTWQVWQSALRGFASEPIPAAPPCP